MRTMGIPRWAAISTAVMLMVVAGIALAVLLLARPESNPFELLKGLATKAEIRATVGPPDKIEVLPRAECWSYGPHDGFTEAKLCFGERGRLAWFAYSTSRRRPPPPAFP